MTAPDANAGATTTPARVPEEAGPARALVIEVPRGTLMRWRDTIAMGASIPDMRPADDVRGEIELVLEKGRQISSPNSSNARHGRPRKWSAVAETCARDEHPGWIEDAMGIVVCTECGAVANHHYEATPDGCPDEIAKLRASRQQLAEALDRAHVEAIKKCAEVIEAYADALQSYHAPGAGFVRGAAERVRDLASGKKETG